MISSSGNLREKLGQVFLLPDGEETAFPAEEDDKDFILSQDFFCTPDYITPDERQICHISGFDKENLPCPKSPVKSCADRNKRYRTGMFACSPPNFGNWTNNFDSKKQCPPRAAELPAETSTAQDWKSIKSSIPGTEKKQSYVSRSAVALRCRVTPPICVKNPYLSGNTVMNLDIVCKQKSKPEALFPSGVGGDGLSRYHTDFHELEEIGCGNFSRVFKVLKRTDGCMYAVKHTIKQLHQETERRRALMEVQALAAVGFQRNIVGYYTSWFENEQLYIQMELCDHSLSLSRSGPLLPSEGEVLEAMHQVAEALHLLHERGIVHLDVKPDNIYVKDGVYKLGDFGCATLKDGSIQIEEGDARYMPLEILNDKHEHLDRVDIFSLGASIYELVKGSPLPASGSHFLALREGKLSLLPGYSLQFQNLLKIMMDPDPRKRPSAKELLKNPIFKERSKADKRTMDEVKNTCED
ncbi:wee1-like protein kinase isoform X2 [Nymphaea colorata]|uniref:wee1-like protein kinase isoform X2 n=1 Tax=Nymphaea colorata TaxID=210225 RepID=UPI00129E3130|nr:wee1-like protein kinase isoform X2 [Nymphaea colorata]